jgi:phage shock protein A
MAKLFKILAASIGGGVVLGAAIRLVEKMASNRAELPHDAGHLLGRMDSLELRLSRMDAGSPPASRSSRRAADPAAPDTIAEDDVAVEAAATMDHAFTSLHNRLNAQQTEVDAIRAQLASASLGIAQLNQKDEKLREELRGWVDENVGQRMTIAEEKLLRSIESAQKNTLDALVEGVQTRVVLRISKLEEEVAGQSAAMADLRECSLSTERSMQKLLEGIDRLVASQSRTETKAREFRAFDSTPREKEHEDDAASTGTADRAPRPDPVFGAGAGEEKPNFRRWGLFR